MFRRVGSIPVAGDRCGLCGGCADFLVVYGILGGRGMVMSEKSGGEGGGWVVVDFRNLSCEAEEKWTRSPWCCGVCVLVTCRLRWSKLKV